MEAQGNEPYLKQARVYEHYSFKNGLPSTVIYKIEKDDHGYLWMITEKGVVRYDGNTFTLIDTNPVEDFVDCYKDSNNLLWLFSYRGRSVGINLNNHQLVNTDSLYGIDRRLPWLFAAELNDSLWLMSKCGLTTQHLVSLKSRKSLSCTDSSRMRQLLETYIPGPLKIDSFDRQYAHHPSSFRAKGGLFLLGNNILEKKQGINIRYYFKGGDYHFQGRISDFERVGDDLWLTNMEPGLLLRIRNHFSSGPRQVDTLLSGIPITRLANDGNGNIWAGSYGFGLYKFASAITSSSIYQPRKTPFFYVRQPVDDIMATTYDDGTLELYRYGPNGQLSPSPIYKTRFNRPVIDIIRHKEQWIVVSAELYKAPVLADGLPGKFSPGYQGLEKVYTYRTHVVENNQLFLLGMYGVISFPYGQYKIDRYPAAINPFTIVRYGDSWIAGTTYGLYYREHYLPYLTNIQINKLVRVGPRYIICSDLGAFVIDSNNVESGAGMQQLTRRPAYDVAEKNGNLFIQANEGIEIFSNTPQPSFIRRFSPSVFTEMDLIKCLYKAGNFLGVLGTSALSVSPDINVLSQVPPPRLHIFNSLKGNIPGDTSCEVLFRPANNATFRVEVVDYNNGRYRASYVILRDGIKWMYSRDADDEPQFTTPTLYPGHYEIIYTVYNEHTGQQSSKRYHLHILPRWYQTNWFIVLCCITILAILILTVVFTWKRIRLVANRKLAEQQRVYELEAKSSIAQLNPHFIFNTLTPLQHFILSGDKAGGLTYLDKYVSLMRKRINNLREKYNSIADEAAFLEDYLQLKEYNTDTRFKYTITVDEQLDLYQEYLPVLLVQPLVENALEHGIRHHANTPEGSIDIRFAKKDNLLCISVTDNGKGMPLNFTPKEHHALEIIAERVSFLKQQYGTGRFILESRKSVSGTIAILHLPLLRKSDLL